MSATDQFPPRHLLPEEEEERTEVSNASGGEQGKDDGNATSTPTPLGLPAPGDSQPSNRRLDISGSEGSGGNRVALNELGPMVVNKDGTLSRIHNWANMTESERERTLRVLGKRNQLRMADLCRDEEGTGSGEAQRSSAQKRNE